MGFLSKAFKGLKKVVNVLGFGIPGYLVKQLKKWLTPDIPGKEGFAIQRAGSNHKIPVVYGTEKVGAIVVDRNVTDASGGAENEFFHVLAVFCYGEIDSFVEFFFNDISENDPRWLKDKNQPNGAKWFTKEVRNGTLDQTAVNATGKLNRFNSTNSKYEGLAIAFFTFQQDEQQSVWGGEPQISAIIKGKKCFDIRTNQTVYTENGALHLLDYIKSPIYGKGLTDADIDLESFEVVANICDQDETSTVSTLECKTINGVYTCTGSTAETVNFKRFSNNLIVDCERTLFQNMQEIANSFRGFFPDSDGRIRISTEIEDTPVFTFNEDNIVSSISITRASKNERYNRVVVRFKNKLANFEADDAIWPDPESTIYQEWLEEDNGVVLEHTIQAEHIKYKAEALQLAELAAKISRNFEQIQFTSTADAFILDIGDIFALDFESYGFVGRQYRIADIEYREDWLCNITGQLHNNGVYPWSDIEYQEFLGGSNLGDPANIPAPTDLQILPDPSFATSGTLTWDVQSNAFIRRFDIQVSLGTNVVYRAEVLGRSWAIPLFDVGNYSISVRAVSSLGTLSPAAAISLILQIPQMPTDIQFTVTYESIEARPVLAGLGIGSAFEFGIGSPVALGRGTTFTFIGLVHTTTYTIYARTITALGVSDWFTKEATTANNANNLLDLIGEDIGASIFDDVVTAVNTELEATVASATADKLDAAEVQQLIDENIALVNEGDSEDIRIELVNSTLAVLDEFKNKASFKRVDFAIIQERQVRAASILQLQASQNAVLNRVDLVESDLEQTNTAISQVEATVNNPTNGLSATFTIASNAKTTADGAASSTTLLQNQVNNPTNGLSATFTLAGSAKTTADANTNAIAGLRVAVAGTNSQSQAELILSATVNKADQAFGRAFLGVTSTSGGVSRINGIIVDGATNTLEFRSDTFRLSDTVGNVQLYWSASRGKWIFNGDIIAATFQTANSGYRAEMSGSGAFPLWYGTGEKTLANASFAVDLAGNVTLNNATVRGAFLSASGDANRVEINTDSTYLLWAGAGTKNDLNGIFWIKANGQGFIKRDFFVGQIVESKFGSADSTSGGVLTITANGHISDGFICEVSVNGYVSAKASGNLTNKTFIVRVTIKRDGITILTNDVLLSGFYESSEGIQETYWQGNFGAVALDSRNVAETRNYTAEISFVGTATFFTVVVRRGTIKTFENKVA